MTHSHDDIKTAMLGRFDPLQVPIVLEMLEDAGIFAMAKTTGESARDTAYQFPTGAGEILVEAACVDTAKALVRDKLPAIMEELSRALDEDSAGQ